MFRWLTVIVALAAGGLFAATAGAGSAVRKCQTSDFKLSAGLAGAALGHYRQTVRLRNISRSTCAVTGWFKVELLNAHGRVLRSREQRITNDYFGTSPKPTVALGTGDSASFAIDTVAPETSCPYSKTVALTPPGGRGSQRLAMEVLACATFAVLPTQRDNKAFRP